MKCLQVLCLIAFAVMVTSWPPVKVQLEKLVRPVQWWSKVPFWRDLHMHCFHRWDLNICLLLDLQHHLQYLCPGLGLQSWIPMQRPPLLCPPCSLPHLHNAKMGKVHHQSIPSWSSLTILLGKNSSLSFLPFLLSGPLPSSDPFFLLSAIFYSLLHFSSVHTPSQPAGFEQLLPSWALPKYSGVGRKS